MLVCGIFRFSLLFVCAAGAYRLFAGRKAMKTDVKDNISLTDILKMCVRHWFVILGSIVLFAVAAYLYSSYVVTPMYKSGGQIYITNTTLSAEERTNLTSGDLSSVEKLGPTFIETMKNDDFLNVVKNMGNFDISTAAIRNMLVLDQPEETGLINIRVNSRSSKQAYAVAKEILRHAPKYLEEKVPGTTVKVFQDARLETAPYAPNIPRNVLFGIIIGLVFGVLLTIGIEIFDKKIDGSEGLEERYGYPVLGEIPNLRGGRGSGVY